MISPLRPLRRRFSDALRDSTALREVRAAAEKRARALETRVEATDLRLGKYAASADQLKGLIEKQAKQLAELRDTTTQLQKQLRSLEKRVTDAPSVTAADRDKQDPP